jgi:hypothetical protein
MASRFRDTKIWSEDWYCRLGGAYQRLWDFICDHCDNAGVWKPNTFEFEAKTGFKVELESFFKLVNEDQPRILICKNGRWFLSGFIHFQWFNKKKAFDLNLNNKLHRSIFELLKINEISVNKVRGLKEVLQASMVMVMEKDLRKEGGAGEENHPRENIPQQPIAPEEPLEPEPKTLIGDMAAKFKSENPNYFFDENDYALLLTISKKLYKWMGQKGKHTDEHNRGAILTRWGEVVVHIRGDSFLCKYSLAQINNHFSSITQSFSNRGNTQSTTPKNGKQSGAYELLRKARNQWTAAGGKPGNST